MTVALTWPKRRHVIGFLLILTTLAAAGAYVLWRQTGSPATADQSLDLRKPRTMVVVDEATGQVRQVLLDDPARTIGLGPVCQRVHTAAGTLICLRMSNRPYTTEITAYDGDMRTRLELSEWGLPSRTRVSPTGNLVTWTLFRTGDSYLTAGAFATTAGIYNLATGAHYGSLEDFAVTVDGKPYKSRDVNFWGVTFTRDDNTFYATMSSQGHTWLISGDLATRSVRTLRGNVECPSLSPDGTRIAYKHRNGKQWRLHVLDLSTGTDVPLAEPAHVDDQPAWLDDSTVVYTRLDLEQPTIFAIPADGTGTPRPLLAAASSPAIIG